MIVGVPIPNNYFMPIESVKSFVGVNSYETFFAEGPYIHLNRNLLFQIARKRNESLLMIDSDVVFTKSDVEKIEKHIATYDAVSGLVPMGKAPYKPWIFRRTDGDYELVKPPNVFDRIDATGAAFLALSKEVVASLEEEPFNPITEGKIQHGEDISFCHRLTSAGFALWCDPSIKLGHIRVDIKNVV